MPDTPAPRHATTELLSVHVDGRADMDEAGFLTAHLPACARCSDELAALAAVRALLRRMPVAEPPRSFTLPLPVAPPEPARIIRFPRLAAITRAASAVAAVFFVLFFTADMAGLGGYDSPSAPDRLGNEMRTSTSAGAPAPQAASAPPQAAPPPPQAQAPAAVAPPAATAPLPTPILAPPLRTADERPTSDAVAASDGARQDGAESGNGRARLGAMASTVNQLAGSPSPLRWSWVGTGLLAGLLLLGAVVLGRRH